MNGEFDLDAIARELVYSMQEEPVENFLNTADAAERKKLLTQIEKHLTCAIAAHAADILADTPSIYPLNLWLAAVALAQSSMVRVYFQGKFTFEHDDAADRAALLHISRLCHCGSMEEIQIFFDILEDLLCVTGEYRIYLLPELEIEACGLMAAFMKKQKAVPLPRDVRWRVELALQIAEHQKRSRYHG